jgi:hypothetical protein
MRMFDLQGALAGAGAAAENLENEAGAVEHLGAPGLLEIALLHRRECAIHYHDAGVVGLHQTGNLFHLAGAQIGGRAHSRKRHDTALGNLEIDGARQADGFIKPRGSVPLERSSACRCLPYDRLDDQRTTGR